MKEFDLTIIDNETGDWTAIYVDGELFKQSHRISEVDWINLIKKYKNFSGKIKRFGFDEDQMEELGGDFPKHI
ncbi:hypothetical protein, partial [Priestia megaterium]